VLVLLLVVVNMNAFFRLLLGHCAWHPRSQAH
jgi:hypothetical protein